MAEEYHQALEIYNAARRANRPVLVYGGTSRLNRRRVPATNELINLLQRMRQVNLEGAMLENKRIERMQKRLRDWVRGNVRRVTAGPRANYRLTRAQLSKMIREWKAKRKKK